MAILLGIGAWLLAAVAFYSFAMLCAPLCEGEECSGIPQPDLCPATIEKLAA